MWKKIEREIKKRGLTQYRLSKMIGVSPSVLTDLKNGRNKKPSFELMEKIADALNVSMDVFRKDDEDGIDKN
ncbi:helix-turn-helix transcriptional regulator [Enterococcus cecorum]|uniref:helix-turn-helix domain-containing protein n=1 Tax=Enterococcus cecorum TaxID=44008 RepID=UPI0032631D8F